MAMHNLHPESAPATSVHPGNSKVRALFEAWEAKYDDLRDRSPVPDEEMNDGMEVVCALGEAIAAAPAESLIDMAMKTVVLADAEGGFDADGLLHVWEDETMFGRYTQRMLADAARIYPPLARYLPAMRRAA